MTEKVTKKPGVSFLRFFLSIYLIHVSYTCFAVVVLKLVLFRAGVFRCCGDEVTFYRAGVFRHCGGDLLLSRDKSKQKRSAHKEGVARSGGFFY